MQTRADYDGLQEDMSRLQVKFLASHIQSIRDVVHYCDRLLNLIR